MPDNETSPVDPGSERPSAEPKTSDQQPTEPDEPAIVWRTTFEDWTRGLEENRRRARRLIAKRDLDRFPRTRPRSPQEAEWLRERLRRGEE